MLLHDAFGINHEKGADVKCMGEGVYVDDCLCDSDLT